MIEGLAPDDSEGKDRPWDQHWMRCALSLAAQAGREDEVPVGAVVVDARQRLLGEGRNQMIAQQDPTAHAEVVALRAACTRNANYRLPGVTLYTTLEPCAMCAGAILLARMATLVYAACDPKTGAAGSVLQLLQCQALNHKVVVRQGVLAEESGALLREFFSARR